MREKFVSGEISMPKKANTQRRDMLIAIIGECSISWEQDITIAAATLPVVCK